MKQLIIFVMLMLVIGIAHAAPDSTQHPKMKNYELWASVGIGNSTQLLNRKNPLSYEPLSRLSNYESSSYTIAYTFRFGVRASPRVSIGVRCRLQSVLYQYSQDSSLFSPNSYYLIHQTNDRYFGNPMLQLGGYGKYIHPLGKVSPFVSLHCSSVHAGIDELKSGREPERIKYYGVGYGGAFGVQYELSNRLRLTAQGEYTRIDIDVFKQSQKSFSFGLQFLF